MLTEVIVSGGARLLRLAASICPQDAEDILNIATERALGRPEAFAHGEPARLYRWLEKVVRNEALKTLRSRRREQLTDPETLAEVVSDSSARGPEEILAATEERIATLEALAELHPVEASCLALRARGFSRAEIAEMLGVTPLTVKRRLADGRAALGDFGDELASGRRCARMRPRLPTTSTAAWRAGSCGASSGTSTTADAAEATSCPCAVSARASLPPCRRPCSSPPQRPRRRAESTSCR